MIRVYVGECAGSHSVGRLWKRWINTVRECLRKRGLYVRQARRMVHKCEWWGFVREYSPDLDKMAQLWAATAI